VLAANHKNIQRTILKFLTLLKDEIKGEFGKITITQPVLKKTC